VPLPAKSRVLDAAVVITFVIPMKTKVRKIGNSLGIVLPKEALEAMHVEEGSSLYITRGANHSLNLRPGEPRFEEKMEIARSLMKRYRNTLKELAK
jgi:putative addiction module antidote